MTELVQRVRRSYTEASERISLTVQYIKESTSLKKPFDLVDNPERLEKSLERYEFPQGVLDAAFVNAAYHGNHQCMRILVEKGANSKAGNFAAIRYATNRGFYDAIKELLESDFIDTYKDLDVQTRQAASNSQIAILRLLYNAGGRIKGHKDKHFDANIENFCIAAEEILDIKNHPNPVLELNKYLKGEQKKLKSDAFNKKIEWSQNNFVKSTIFAATVMGILSKFVPIYKPLLQELVKNDIKKVEETKGLSWRKYVEAMDVNLRRIDTFNDVILEFAESAVLPTLATHLGDYREMSAWTVRDLRISAQEIAARIILSGKSTLDFGALNESWHKPGNAIPDELKPHVSVGAIIPLFKGCIDIGESYSIIDLNTAQALKDEGKALSHCVGGGSYHRTCQNGKAHILSLKQNGRSVATIQLSRVEKNGEIKDPKGVEWKVRQFYAEKNSTPKVSDMTAWNNFCEMVNENKVEISPIHGAFKDSKDNSKRERLTELEKIICFDMDDYQETLTKILAHYNERVVIKRNKSTVSLLNFQTREEFEAEVHRLCKDLEVKLISKERTLLVQENMPLVPDLLELGLLPLDDDLDEPLF